MSWADISHAFSSWNRQRRSDPMAKRSVVFVVSSSHSGSTWTGYILGSHPQSAFLGEYHRGWNAEIVYPAPGVRPMGERHARCCRESTGCLKRTRSISPSHASRNRFWWTHPRGSIGPGGSSGTTISRSPPFISFATRAAITTLESGALPRNPGPR